MATKTCPNGHKYDSSIYGNNCPFCPNSGDETIGNDDFDGGETRATGGYDDDEPTAPTGEYDPDGGDGEGTIVIDPSDPSFEEPKKKKPSGRRLVGLLVSYSDNPSGEVYKVFEGRTTIGKSRLCDIPFPDDKYMSSNHLLIQYVAAKGEFRAQEYDKGSSNGTYVNGEVYVLGDSITLNNGDVIVLGGTKFKFLAIPKF